MAVATNYCGVVFRHLAREFERLNEFALSLVASNAFVEVLSGSFIREYTPDWIIQKYVEATIEPKEPLFAGWWIEIEEEHSAFRLYAYTCVDKRGYLTELKVRRARTVDGFAKELGALITELIDTYSEGAEFRRYLDGLRAE